MVLWDDFWTLSRLFSPWRFNEWIPLVVATLFSYWTRPHFTPNCTCFLNDLPFSHDKAFRWSLSHYSGGIIILIHKLRFMSSILLDFCNTFFPHQFGVATKGGCESIIHDIKCIVDLHPDWLVFQLDVANAFNSVLRKVIFQELCVLSGDII
jgi:hypothetical protein